MASIKVNYDKHGTIISCRFRVCLGRDELGKQIWATKTVTDIPNDKTEAKIQKAWKLQADLWEQGLLDGTQSKDNSTFQGFVEGDFWMLHVQSGKLRDSTVSFYTNIKPRCIEYFGKRKLSTIKQTDIEKFLIWLSRQKQKNGQPLTAGTQKHIFNFIKIVFNFAVNKGYIQRNPTQGVKPPKQPHKTVDYLPPVEAQKFLKALDTLDEKELHWRAAMQVLIYLGLRRGELCGLQWGDIDFEQSTLSVKRNVTYTASYGVKIGEPKTANSFRTLPIPDTVAATLRAWKTKQLHKFRDQVGDTGASIVITPAAFVFSERTDPYTPIFPTAVTKWLSRFVKEQGLPNVSPHDLRHTCGSLLLESGANLKAVQAFLGHEDASTTLRFYAGVDADSLKKAADSLASALATTC